MRILNNDTNVPLESITIYLKKDEAIELMMTLEDLLNSEKNAEHSHVNDLEYTHEITVTIYDDDNLNGFDQRSKKLIQENA